MRRYCFLVMHSNKKIHRYFYRAVALFILLNVLKFIYDKCLTFNDLLDDIRARNLKSVQLLTGRFGFKNWEFDALGEEPFKNCPEKRCYAFRSHPLIHIANEKSDGVMVHGPNLWYMPSRTSYKRNPGQLWLFYSMEPQRLTFCSSHYDLADLDDWFNITATFKHDSELPLDYKQFRTWDDVVHDLDYVSEYKKSNALPHITDLSGKNVKKASVVWFVSHCETNSRREAYVRELQKFIDVDIYGECGDYFPNSLKDPCGSKKNIKCFNRLMNEYR
jgi:hypothetical protein